MFNSKSSSVLLVFALVASSFAGITVVDLIASGTKAYTGIFNAATGLATLSPSQLKNVGSDYITILDFESGLNKVIYATKGTATLYQTLGNLECNGNDNNLGIPIFSFIWGNFITGDKSTDLGGDYACPASCKGTCVSAPTDQPNSPGSLYPFGCKCGADGCDANGPKMPTNWAVIGANVVCEKDPLCTCAQIDPANPDQAYTGYLCNWINVANNQTIFLKLNNRLSPIRWCDCCPNA